MQLGIFAKTFSGDIEDNLAAVTSAGFAAVQYNLSIAGIDTVPSDVPDGLLERVTAAADANGVTLAAISGTFNAAHPDPAVRRSGVERFRVLAQAAATLNVPVITLSSGSRNRDDMWAIHPDNATDEAWADSRETLTELADIAESAGVFIAVEPEYSNVAATAALGRRMLDEVGSDRLRIVFDAANLMDTSDLSPGTMRRVIDEALDLVGGDIALAHAKELVPGRAPVAPGQGVLPWQHIVTGLEQVGYDGALIVHGLPEAAVPVARSTLGPLVDGQR